MGFSYTLLALSKAYTPEEIDTFTDDFTGWRQITLPFTGFTRSATQPPNAPNDGLGLNQVSGYGFEIPQGAGQTGQFLLDQVRVVNNVPTAIELADFTATVQSDGTVQVEWATSAEIDNAGFNLYRRDVVNGGERQINSLLIASQSANGNGATYTFSDTPAAGIWEYSLEEVETDGDTVQAFAAAPTDESTTPAPADDAAAR